MKRDDAAYLFWTFAAWFAAQLFCKVVMHQEVSALLLLGFGAAIYGAAWLLSTAMHWALSRKVKSEVTNAEDA